MKIRAASILITLLPATAIAQAERPAPRPEHAGEHRPQTRPDDPADKMPDLAPARAPTEPVEKSGPPAHAVLRESDFDYSACLLELALLGADYREVPSVTDAENADCGIDRPIQLTAPLPGIEIAGGAPMRCDTARHLAHWLRDFARPAAAMLPGQPQIVTIEPGSTYQCRDTVGNGGGKMSEHALGNAFDIAAFGFQDGSRIEIAPRQDDGDLIEAFQRALRASACLHFTTVLGPGSNAAHDDHLHLDIKARNGGYRLCQ